MEAIINAKYLSRYRNLRIVRRSAVTREVNGQVVTTPGESIRFEEGLFQTTDVDTQAFIEARQEFKDGLIIRVPDNVQDLIATQKEWMKSLETRELEAELAKRKKTEGEAKDSIKESTSNEEGAGVKTDGLEAKSVASLQKLAKNEGVEAKAIKKAGDDKEALLTLIRTKRSEASEDEPEY